MIDVRTHGFWLDVVMGEGVSKLADAHSEADLDPAVHVELAEKYGLLSEHYRRWPVMRPLARWLSERSADHGEKGGGDLPPAVAVAMPVPLEVAGDRANAHRRRHLHGSEPDPGPKL